MKDIENPHALRLIDQAKQHSETGAFIKARKIIVGGIALRVSKIASENEVIGTPEMADIDDASLYLVYADVGARTGESVEEFCDQWNFARMCRNFSPADEDNFKSLFKQYYPGLTQPISDWLDWESPDQAN